MDNDETRNDQDTQQDEHQPAMENAEEQPAVATAEEEKEEKVPYEILEKIPQEARVVHYKS